MAEHEVHAADEQVGHAVLVECVEYPVKIHDKPPPSSLRLAMYLAIVKHSPL